MKLDPIKNTLDKRSIKPSADSWDKLATRLDAVQTEKKKVKHLYWLSAVAAALVVLVISYTFVNSNLNSNTKNTLAVEPTNSLELNNEKDKAGDQIKSVMSQDAFVRNDKNTEQESNKQTANKTQPIINKTKTQNRNEYAIEDPIVSNDNTKTVQNYMNSNAVVQNAQQNNQTIPSSSVDAKLTATQEAEALLNKALNTTKNTGTAKANNKVNAQLLLIDAEYDARETTKNKIDKFLYDQFGKIKAEAYSMVRKN